MADRIPSGLHTKVSIVSLYTLNIGAENRRSSYGLVIILVLLVSPQNVGVQVVSSETVMVLVGAFA